MGCRVRQYKTDTSHNHFTSLLPLLCTLPEGSLGGLQGPAVRINMYFRQLRQSHPFCCYFTFVALPVQPGWAARAGSKDQYVFKTVTPFPSLLLRLSHYLCSLAGLQGPAVGVKIAPSTWSSRRSIQGGCTENTRTGTCIGVSVWYINNISAHKSC